MASNLPMEVKAIRQLHSMILTHNNNLTITKAIHPNKTTMANSSSSSSNSMRTNRVMAPQQEVRTMPAPTHLRRIQAGQATHKAHQVKKASED